LAQIKTITEQFYCGQMSRDGKRTEQELDWASYLSLFAAGIRFQIKYSLFSYLATMDTLLDTCFIESLRLRG
jgi:hypothetical protein